MLSNFIPLPMQQIECLLPFFTQIDTKYLNVLIICSTINGNVLLHFTEQEGRNHDEQRG
jgi:hypothetical protein